MKKRYCIAFCSLLAISIYANAQLKLTQDTVDSPYIGFSFGTIFASDKLSSENGMHDLYKNPFFSFGVETGYKFKSNWLLSLDGNLVFGTDVRDKEKRYGDAFSHDYTPIIIGENGTDATASIYNRALAFRIGGGKIFNTNKLNPNSGITLRLLGGFWQQKTVFMMYKENAPQLQDDYARLYDNKRRGFNITESIGYWLMSNNYNFFNFHIAFELTQSWTHSTRDYVIDNVMGLRGKDNKTYFDLLYTLKITWVFPLKGKTAYDYYFF